VRILLDENLGWRLKRERSGHTVECVPLIGWAGLKNGALLAQAETQFDVLITMDGSMPHQQTLARSKSPSSHSKHRATDWRIRAPDAEGPRVDDTSERNSHCDFYLTSWARR
jgi:hypothetical protein